MQPLIQHSQCFSTLSDEAILRYRDAGRIIIEPFNKRQLSTSSYDVTLGPFYYRETEPSTLLLDFADHPPFLNPYSARHVKNVWGQVQTAEKAEDWSLRNGTVLENIRPNESIIWIRPGETILAHTNEFIGGTKTVTTMMKARSSLGRNFIEVCKCAGWGDIGYTNRWTMEITNNSRHYSIPLVVGRRIAQIVFFDTEGAKDGMSYATSGKYQTSTDIEQLQKNWRPSDMLPKMYNDWECSTPATSSTTEGGLSQYAPEEA